MRKAILNEQDGILRNGMWRNWYTQLSQKQSPKGMRVQVPPSRPDYFQNLQPNIRTPAQIIHALHLGTPVAKEAS